MGIYRIGVYMNNSKTLINMALAALMAAIYVALCYVLQPISFGPIQFLSDCT